MKKRKVSFIGYTTKKWDVVWTVNNILNLAFIIQKTKNEAMARYDDYTGSRKNVSKIKITIEEI